MARRPSTRTRRRAERRGSTDRGVVVPEAPGPVRVVVVAHGPPMRGGMVTVATDITEDPQLNDEFEIVFVNTSQNDDARGEFALTNVVRAFSHAAATFRAARRGAVVHTHSVQHPVFVAWRQVAIAIAARLRGATVLLHNHGYLPYMSEPGGYSMSRGHRLAMAVLDRLAPVNILIGESGIANLRPYMATIRLPVVHNSVVVDEVPLGSATNEPPVVLFIGELLERKGIGVLLDALDILDERGGSDHELRIVGDYTAGMDPDRDEMVARIRSRGRGHALTGALGRDEVYQHLADADVFVLPTEYEGQPFTIIEALAAGVPIVATDIPPIASMLDDPDNATLVPWGDPGALADALQAMLADPERRRMISDANRALAAGRFDRSVFRSSLTELYRRYGRPRSGNPGNSRR